MIQWLHITDLHMINQNDADQENFCHTLLKSCARQQIRADFIVATGDFCNFTAGNTRPVSWNFLHKLVNALHLDIQKDLFLVPGNHDIDREQARHSKNVQTFLSYAKRDAGNRLHIKKTADQDLDYARILGIHPELSRKFLGDFKSYREIAGSLIQMYHPKAHVSLHPASVHVRTWNNRLNVLHLNTAILSDGTRSHAEAADISQACSGRIRNALHNNLPTIVLGHHSFHDLHPTIKTRLVQLFNQTNVWAYLAGDKHRTNYKGDDYLIDRKTGLNAWPNIIAGKAAAAVNDDYSEFGVVLYCWDEHSTVTLQYLRWNPEDSGIGLTGTPGRSFPMRMDLNSRLYYFLSDRLLKMRDSHPSFQLMKIEEELFPKAYLSLYAGSTAAGKKGEAAGRPLSDFFRESWNTAEQNHLTLTGEGGIGKTVSLLSLATRKGFLPHHVPAIYIPLHALKTKNTDDSIGSYLLEKTLDGDDMQYSKLLQMARLEWKDGPRLILLLDGFNEIHRNALFIITRNIEAWSGRPGVQIIVTSRFDMHRSFSSLQGKLTTLHLQPLRRQQIQDYLSQAGMPSLPADSALWTVIHYPLMLALYSQSEVLHSKNCLIPLDWLEQKNPGTIIWNYLQGELWRCQSRTTDPEAPVHYVLATEIIAPYLAWKMVQNGQFLVSERDFSLWITEALAHLKTTPRKNWPEHVQRVLRQCGGMTCLPDLNVFFRLLTQELNLFRIRGNGSAPMVSLMHQHFRDCLAAIHLSNLAEAIPDGDTLPDEWREIIDYYVMNFFVYLLKPQSPVPEKLWNANRALQPTQRSATINLLELYKRYRQCDFSELNFSHMDLRKIRLHNYRLPEGTHLQLPGNADKTCGLILSPDTFEPEGHRDIITKIAVLPDNRRFITASYDSTLQIRDINTGKSLQELNGHTSAVSDMVPATDGRFCVSASHDGTIRIWNTDTGKCIRILKGHTDYVEAVAICTDGRTCASASRDGTVRMWCMKNKNMLSASPIFGREHIRCIIHTQAAENHYFVCVSKNGHVRIWNVAQCHFLPLLKGCIHDNIYEAAMSPNGRRFMMATDNGLQVWDTASGKRVAFLPFFFLALAITADNRNIVGLCPDHTLQILSLEKLNCVKSIPIPSEKEPVGITLLPDGTQCLVSFTSHTQVWDLMNEQLLGTLEHASGETIISPDNRRCICADDSLNVWNLETYEKICDVEDGYISISAVAITPDSRQCVSASGDGLVRIWDIRQGRLAGFMEDPCPHIYALTVSEDGSQCIAVSKYGIVQTWDMATRKKINSRKLCDMWFLSAAVTPDGRWCACSTRQDSQGQQENVLLWDLTSEKGPHILPDVSYSVMALSADGKSLFVSYNHIHESGCLRMIDIFSGKETPLSWKPAGRHSMLADDQINAISVTPDMAHMVLGTCNDIAIWHKGEKTAQVIAQNDWIHSTTLSPDGKYCVCGASNTLYVWDIDACRCISALELLPGIDLLGVNLSRAEFEPAHYGVTLSQNGAIISPINNPGGSQ